ncbi:MAG TPA: hypothetical protein VFU22_04870 [Roseiflexaceae bacterium]|nr:hypothetical protein [Roseiflexaceae bacterium]
MAQLSVGIITTSLSNERGDGYHRALEEAGLRVSEDFAIDGCGDISLAALVCPRLATVGQPKQHLTWARRQCISCPNSSTIA